MWNLVISSPFVWLKLLCSSLRDFVRCFLIIVWGYNIYSSNARTRTLRQNYIFSKNVSAHWIAKNMGCIKIAMLTQTSSYSCILGKYFSLKARNFWEVLIASKSKRLTIEAKTIPYSKSEIMIKVIIINKYLQKNTSK